MVRVSLITNKGNKRAKTKMCEKEELSFSVVGDKFYLYG